jgi:quercetin dioxygenase-like cupin family protein
MRAVVSDVRRGRLDEPYRPPHCTVHGAARGAIFSPDGYSLWRILGQLGAGATLRWTAPHGDEALYVLEGMLGVDGTTVEAPSAVIIEANVDAEVRALEDTQLVHFGPTSSDQPSNGFFGPAAIEGRQVHVFPLGSRARTSPDVQRAAATYFSDGTCQTCRIAFFMVDCANAEGFASTSHTHSEDEIIHVLEGGLQVGPLKVDPGMSIAVPRDVRYGFRTTGPFRFLNYRRDVAAFTGAPRSEPQVELSTGLVGIHTLAGRTTEA